MQAKQDAKEQTLYLVPHTHWEGAVFFTREEYLKMGLSHILTAIHLLEKYPDYKFTLDQVAYFKPFLERYPEEAAAFRKFVANGRLQIVGGMDVMPDDVKPGGELFIRQIQYGKRYCREQLGVEVDVAWLVDTFGHHPQLPQLLKLAGYKSFWFCRGVPNDDLPSEFMWSGIDGTRIPAFWVPGFYGLFYGPPRDKAGFKSFFVDRYNALNKHVHDSERVGLAGVDVSDPEEYVPPMVSEFNLLPDSLFKIRYSVPSEFAAKVAQRANTPVLSGDFNPIFPGTYSSRIELKQLTREIEQEFLTAETLDALSGRLGNLTADNMLNDIWEPVLFNQTHDLASGVMADHVYDDTLRSYAHSRRLADELIDSRSANIISRIDTRGDGIPVVVFNTLGAPQTGLVETEVGFASPPAPPYGSYDNNAGVIREKGSPVRIRMEGKREENAPQPPHTGLATIMGEQLPTPDTRHPAPYSLPPTPYSLIRGIEVRDPAGKSIPVQLVSAERYSDGGIKSAKICFQAGDVPAVGYATYRIIPNDAADLSQVAPAGVPVNNVMENELLRVTIDLKTGAITSIFDKTLQTEMLSGPANVISRHQDKGDLWELYHTLDGASYIAGTSVQPVPKPGEALFSSDFSGKAGTIQRGPVYSEFSVSHPFGNGSFATRIRLYPGSPRIDIETKLVNNEKYVRYQALFPTTIKNGRNVQEIPFGAVERPIGVEYPAQNWVDYSDGKRGVALFNAGMPGNVITDGTLMLSLLRSHSLGDYNEGHTSESGFELNVPRTFRYSIVSHAGNWQDATIYREAQQFNHPLIVRKCSIHKGDLPNSWGIVEISNPNVVLTTFKPGAGKTTILRVYEASGKATKGARIKLNTRIEAANEANLLEDTGRKLTVQNNSVLLDLHPFEIFTMKLKLSPAKKAK